MFGGEASDKKVKVLSGGERSRLAMIKLLLEQVNMLILDEPTNHLDMRSKDVLKEAIKEFKGTVIVVSHDRDFMHGLVDKVYRVHGGKLREIDKGWLDSTTAVSVDETTIQKQEPVDEKRKTKNDDWSGQKERRRKQEKLERELAGVEETISQLEAAMKILEERMATPEGAADMEMAGKYERLSRQHDEAMEEWSDIATRLDNIKNEQ